MTRILIVEDHTLFADAIRSTLEDLDMEVLEPCTTGAEALESVRRDRPDVVNPLLDRLWTAADQIRSERPQGHCPDANGRV